MLWLENVASGPHAAGSALVLCDLIDDKNTAPETIISVARTFLKRGRDSEREKQRYSGGQRQTPRLR